MLLFVLLLVSLMFIFVNSLYYTIRLLIVVLLLLASLVFTLNLSTLTIVILCIVYLGAMIILIGYICAICPNILTDPLTHQYAFLLSARVLLHLYFSKLPIPSNTPLTLSIVEFFYSRQGFSVFIVIFLMLFITLLIVTCQYLSPKGPFRSVSI